MATDAQRFFDEYARAASGRDPEDLAAFYDESLVHSGPKGTLGFRNDARYRSWLTDVLDYNEANGLQTLVPTGVGSYELGPSLVLATVQWQARFARVERPAEFTVTYVLRRAADGLRIACAASHEDQEEQVRRAGVAAGARPRSGTKRVRRTATRAQRTPQA